MKNLRLLFYVLFFLLFLSNVSDSYSQTVGISNVAHDPDTNAVLDIYSTNKGIIIPRVIDSTSINNASKGYLAYFTATHSIWFYDSFKWCELSSAQKDISITDSMYLGSTNNHVLIEEDGSVFLRGDATTYDDLQVPVLTTVKGTSNPPDNLQVLTNLIIYGFDASKDEEIFFVVQLPHTYKEGTDIFPHVHWMPTNTNTGDVTWKLEYTWANNQGTFASTSTVSGTSTASGTANEHLITQLTTIDGTGKKISSMIICRLYREGTSTSDTYNADAGLLEFDFHFEVDSFGSRLEYIK